MRQEAAWLQVARGEIENGERVEGRLIEVSSSSSEEWKEEQEEMTVLDDVASDFKLTLVANLQALAAEAHLRKAAAISFPTLILVSIFVLKK